jgi:hypothetical protein
VYDTVATINSLIEIIRMATRKVPTKVARKVPTKAARKVPTKAVLIDLSGTLHIENTAIPGAVDSLKRCVND